MRLWGIAAAIVLGLVATTQAAPPDLKQVPAGAKLLAHVDVDAMRSSVLVQRAYDKVSEKWPDARQRFDEVTDLVNNLGIELERDLHGLTIYSLEIGKPEAVLLVDAVVDRKSLLEKADQAPDHEMTKCGDYELHSWTDAKGKRHEHPMVGTLSKSNLLIFAPTIDQVKAALDVLDGKTPSLAGKQSPLAASIPEGTMILVRAVGLAGANLPLKSPLVTECDALSVRIGEHDGKVAVEGKLTAKSKETAEKAKAIVDGGKATVELRHSDDADVMKVLKAVKVDLADKTLSIEVSSPVDDVWSLAEKGAALAQKHREKKKAGAEKQEK